MVLLRKLGNKRKQSKTWNIIHEEGREIIQQWRDARLRKQRSGNKWYQQFLLCSLSVDTLKSFLQNINCLVILQMIFAVMSVYVFKSFDVSLDIPLGLFVSPIIFPLAFSINTDFQRREKVLEDLAHFKSSGLMWYFCMREWQQASRLDAKWMTAVRGKLKSLLFHLQEYLLALQTENRKVVLRVIYEDISDANQLIEQLRASKLPSNTAIISKSIHLLHMMCQSFERIRVVREYRSPRSIRSFTKLFIMCLPTLLSPYFVYLGDKTRWGSYYIAVLVAFVFAALQSVQDKLDDPFNGMNEDDINLDAIDEWTSGSLEHTMKRSFDIGRFENSLNCNSYQKRSLKREKEVNSSNDLNRTFSGKTSIRKNNFDIEEITTKSTQITTRNFQRDYFRSNSVISTDYDDVSLQSVPDQRACNSKRKDSGPERGSKGSWGKEKITDQETERLVSDKTDHRTVRVASNRKKVRRQNKLSCDRTNSNTSAVVLNDIEEEVKPDREAKRDREFSLDMPDSFDQDTEIPSNEITNDLEQRLPNTPNQVLNTNNENMNLGKNVNLDDNAYDGNDVIDTNYHDYGRDVTYVPLKTCVPLKSKSTPNMIRNDSTTKLEPSVVDSFLEKEVKRPRSALSNRFSDLNNFHVVTLNECQNMRPLMHTAAVENEKSGGLLASLKETLTTLNPFLPNDCFVRKEHRSEEIRNYLYYVNRLIYLFPYGVEGTQTFLLNRLGSVFYVLDPHFVASGKPKNVSETPKTGPRQFIEIQGKG